MGFLKEWVIPGAICSTVGLSVFFYQYSQRETPEPQETRQKFECKPHQVIQAYLDLKNSDYPRLTMFITKFGNDADLNLVTQTEWGKEKRGGPDSNTHLTRIPLKELSDKFMKENKKYIDIMLAEPENYENLVHIDNLEKAKLLQPFVEKKLNNPGPPGPFGIKDYRLD